MSGIGMCVLVEQKYAFCIGRKGHNVFNKRMMAQLAEQPIHMIFRYLGAKNKKATYLLYLILTVLDDWMVNVTVCLKR